MSEFFCKQLVCPNAGDKDIQYIPFEQWYPSVFQYKSHIQPMQNVELLEVASLVLEGK